MDESRVRYSKLSMMTATNRLSIWRARWRRGVRGDPEQRNKLRGKERIHKFVRLKVPNHSPADPAGGSAFSQLSHTPHRASADSTLLCHFIFAKHASVASVIYSVSFFVTAAAEGAAVATHSQRPEEVKAQLQALLPVSRPYARLPQLPIRDLVGGLPVDALQRMQGLLSNNLKLFTALKCFRDPVLMLTCSATFIVHLLCSRHSSRCQEWEVRKFGSEIYFHD